MICDGPATHIFIPRVGGKISKPLFHPKMKKIPTAYNEPIVKNFCQKIIMSEKKATIKKPHSRRAM